MTTSANPVKLSFYGAAGTVTGSRYLLETEAQRILIDCGLFQGYKQLRLRNWAPLPFDPASLDAVILTHAHIDHNGASTVRIHGENFPVRAEVRQLRAGSSHADADELLAWMKKLASPPRQTFITHGEPGASDTLRQRIERELGWTRWFPSIGRPSN